MNKDDLLAWKNYDNNQYSLIPGISVQKKTLDRDALKNSNSANALNKSALIGDKFQERQDMMKQYGFSRDPRDAYASSGQNEPRMGGLRVDLNESMDIDASLQPAIASY